MRIGIISDTHDNKNAIYKAIKRFKAYNIEILIHAGDHISPFVVDWMAELNCKIYGVAGNNEGEKELIKKKYIERGWEYSYELGEIELNIAKICIYHGTIESILKTLIKSGEYDIVISGHTHRPNIKQYSNGVLHINPGEACGYLTGKETIAILELPSKVAKIIEL